MSNVRVPGGVPDGGQFAAGTRAEIDVSLDTPPERAFADAPEAFARKYDTIEEKVAAFKVELESAVSGLAEDENWLRYVAAMSKFHRYSFNNQMLIAIQTSGRATKVAGFRTWAGLGRHVKAGEKGIGILAPRIINVAKKDDNGKPVKGPDGKPVKARQVVGFTTATVFDVSQTDGDPLPFADVELSEDPPDGFVDDMVAAAEKAGYGVEFRPMDSTRSATASGWSDGRAKRIVVDSDLSPGSQAATLAHELGHVYARHCEPEHAESYAAGASGCRGRFEIEAESVAYALGRVNGMAMGDGRLSATYIAGWSRGDRELLRESGEAVSGALKGILGATKFRNAESSP
ncbi:MAG: ArdC-like ssDNA-binding domain-containing protein [Nocardioides sp.]